MKQNDRRTPGVPCAAAWLVVFAAACSANTARQIPSPDRRGSADVSCAVDLTDLWTTSNDYLLRFTALTTGVNNEIGKVDRTATPRAQDLMSGALGKLILGVNTDPSYTIEAAQDMIARVLAAQNMDPSSANFGQIPWTLDVPPPPNEDANRTEFAMQPMGTILSRWGGCLDQGFIADAIPHIEAAIAALKGHTASPIPVAYTNIYLMNSMNLILLGEAIGDAGTAAAKPVLRDLSLIESFSSSLAATAW